MMMLLQNSRHLYFTPKNSLIRSYRTFNKSTPISLSRLNEKHPRLLKQFYCDSTAHCFTPKNPCTSEPGKWPTGNRSTYKFNAETETALNSQVNIEFKAFYSYLSMASYFDRVDVSLPGCRNYFLKMHHEEHDHAMQFINYINLRGGSVTLCPIEVPPDQDWKCPLNAFQTALQLETEVTEKLESINEIAKKNCDLITSDFVITNFMHEQMHSINELGKLISVLSGISDCGLNRYLFDQDLLKSCPDSNNQHNHHGQCK